MLRITCKAPSTYPPVLPDKPVSPAAIPANVKHENTFHLVFRGRPSWRRWNSSEEKVTKIY